jgi:hypothetical protein
MRAKLAEIPFRGRVLLLERLNTEYHSPGFLERFPAGIWWVLFGAYWPLRYLISDDATSTVSPPYCTVRTSVWMCLLPIRYLPFLFKRGSLYFTRHMEKPPSSCQRVERSAANQEEEINHPNYEYGNIP